MTLKNAKRLQIHDSILVEGIVRKVHETGKWVEVQFPTYSLNIPIEYILLPRKVSAKRILQ